MSWIALNRNKIEKVHERLKAQNDKGCKVKDNLEENICDTRRAKVQLIRSALKYSQLNTKML